MGDATRGARSPLEGAGLPREGDLLSRSLPPFHARRHRSHEAVQPKGQWRDLVESAFLFQGLLCARAYFDCDAPEEKRIRDRITYLWSEAEWDWYTQGARTALTWHWSPTNGFALNHPVRGWNECLIAYVLAASAPRYAMPAEAYHEGWVQSRQFVNRRSSRASSFRSDRTRADRSSSPIIPSAASIRAG